jgi:predicted methyltransferase
MHESWDLTDKSIFMVSDEEINALIAALTFAKPKSLNWLPIDDQLLVRLKNLQEIRTRGRYTIE